MYRALVFLVAVLSLFSASAATAGTPSASGTCTKIGAKTTIKKVAYTCVKSGSKKVWAKSSSVKPTLAPVTEPTKTATPPLVPEPKPEIPTSFDDLFEKRTGISWSAWSQVSKTVATSSPRSGKLEVYTGPNTTPYFDDYPRVIGLVSRAFPNFAIPARTVVIRYAYSDLHWAEDFMKSAVSAQEYDQLQRNESGHLVDSNCQMTEQSCGGAKAITSLSGVAFILQGIQKQVNRKDPTQDARVFQGQVEAHEFFHTMQDIAVKISSAKGNVWGLRWLVEGGAEWAQNVTMNSDSYEAYLTFLKNDCQGMCATMTEAQILEFLELGERATDKYERWLGYNLGSRIIEVLVALRGQESILEIYTKIADGATFDSAFKAIYGIEWKKAKPSIAKAIASNIADRS